MNWYDLERSRKRRLTIFTITFKVDRQAHVAKETLPPDDPLSLEESSLSELMLWACEAIDLNRISKFEVNFDGTQPAHLDIQTDFAIFLEQMPVLTSLASPRAEAKISLFEQGTSLNLFFRRNGGIVAVEARSMLTNVTVGLAESTTEMFFAQIQAVRTVFLTCCQELCPSLMGFASFARWIRLSEMVNLST